MNASASSIAPATILITGGSGFLGSRCIAQALAAGHRVRASVRDPAREPQLRAALARAGVDAGDRLSLHAADLRRDDGWSAAAAGCDYALHVASPFPAEIPRDENELIAPAREGTLRVLRAARDAGLRRVVLTSSFAAVGYGHPPRPAPFDESVWSDTAAPLAPYVKSKTLAERAAWEFVAGEGGGLELAVVNPVGIFGPVLSDDYATSILLVKRLLDGALPGTPKLHFGVVDVRDVAELHLRVMTDPAARGERFLATAGDFLSVSEMAALLRRNLGAAARKAPTRELPNWLVRLAALADPAVRQIVPDLGNRKNASNAKAKRVLGWNPRSAEEALVATARSLIELGVVRG
ncbi:NAD-dependent epimerase/dehydratase [Lysobacter enzymogenes]|uniref:NAD-dependent epimerase/dehydratase n=1 Tax=Lysobacter enzymogenes TaxID=69 RepID=A0A0S2DHZ5_LYSEN|nr:aldehyde reductase [Lysobacter enzymogenes]ALN58116.1 NAD-dependent epimerase/dehydratase [Lysobacter enzymogenes]